MADTLHVDAPPTGKKSKKPIILGFILLLLGAGGGFGAVSMGLIGDTTLDSDHASDATDTKSSGLLSLSFVPLEPIIVSYANGTDRRVLRLVAQLEVNPASVAEIEHIKPRIFDVLNGYLRALEVSDLEAPAALLKIRSQLLHRVEIVTGENRVNDLLITEFVLN